MNMADVHLCVAETPVHSVWKHLKTGNQYIVTGHVMIESTWKPGVVYSGKDSFHIVRDGDEFIDGRFERIK